ncbi:MAG TPA: LPS export ABC transporter permease LptG [Candidatus Binataceae bacterium]|nr:LPS export ABC transporter permease LptG [Candidatus Binataceae bacterium]
MSARPRLSPTMDRFLGGQFLGPFFVCLVGFTIAYLLGDMFDRFKDLIHYGGFGLLGLAYFALKIPLIISQLLPVACLAGVLLGFAILNRSGEVLACQQLGISRLEMAVPVLVIAGVIAIFNFVLNETLVPITTRQARYLYEVELKRRELKGVFAHQRIWVRERGGFISADRYDARTSTLRGVTIYQLDNNYALRDIEHAVSAKWNGSGWVPENPTTFRVEQNGQISPLDHFSVFGQSLKPTDLSLLKLDPEEFSLWELDRYIRSLRRKGLDPGGYMVDLDLKYAMPLACVIMVALGIALSLDPLPRSLTLGRSFILAIAIGFGYWLSFGLTSSLGRSDIIPAWVAAWTPNMIFTVLAFAIFLFGEER